MQIVYNHRSKQKPDVVYVHKLGRAAVVVGAVGGGFDGIKVSLSLCRQMLRTLVTLLHMQMSPVVSPLLLLLLQCVLHN